MHGMVFCLVRFFFRAVGFLFRAVRIFVVGFVGGHLARQGRDVAEDDFRVDRRLDNLSPHENGQERGTGSGPGLVGPGAGVLATVGRPHLGDQQAAVLENLDPARKAELTVWKK